MGWDSKYTVAVWVGYPDKLVPMTTDFNGGPVLGGTFPALIWHDFMTSALQIDKTRAEQAAAAKSNSPNGSGASTTSAPETISPSTTGTTPGHGANQTGTPRRTSSPPRRAARATEPAAGLPAAEPRTLRSAADAGPAAGTRSAERSRGSVHPGCPVISSPTGGVSPGG